MKEKAEKISKNRLVQVKTQKKEFLPAAFNLRKFSLSDSDIHFKRTGRNYISNIYK